MWKLDAVMSLLHDSVIVGRAIITRRNPPASVPLPAIRHIQSGSRAEQQRLSLCLQAINCILRAFDCIEHTRRRVNSLLHHYYTSIIIVHNASSKPSPA